MVMNDNNIGKKLDGRYELLELIGVGGMADIYKARDIVEDKIVAAKILKNEFAGSEDFLRRFRNESKAIALLSHPNIVKIVDVGFTDKVQFIVMEYIDGITLTEFIEQQGILKWRDAIHFTTQILRALQHAHDRGIVHRDIKSQNVMLLPDGTIKVMDFGIARFNRETDKTISEKAIGSVHYISPEQARGDITDEKSDIYSVGVMLYEMLTGKKPFDGDNPVSIALMHMQVEPKKMAELNNSVPEGLEEITMKAMQKEPVKRYQTAGEMIKDIEEFKKNPSIVFEYKYFSSDGATQYFEKVGSNTNDKSKPNKKLNNELSAGKNSNDDYDDYEDDDEEYYDYDDEVAERRSPLLPILFAVATVFVIMTAWLIYTIVTQNIGEIDKAAGDEMSMPYLIGMNYDTARSMYPEIKFDPVQDFSAEYDKDVIMEQSVPKNRKIKSNQKIEVKVSKGPKLITLDDYGNGLRHYEDVVMLIKKQGFPDPNLKYVESDTVAADYVIKTEPAARSMLEEDTKIIVYVSLGNYGSPTNVPDFITLSRVTAQEHADMYDIIPVFVEMPSSEAEKGKVFWQSIDPMTQVEKKTTVELHIGTGIPPVKSGKISANISTSRTGDYIFRYYIDGVLQEDMTETRNIELSRKILWEFENSGVHLYAIYFESCATGKSGKYCEYEFDFTGDTTAYDKLYENTKIFQELSKTEETTTTTKPEETEEPVDLPVDNDDDELPDDNVDTEIFD